MKAQAMVAADHAGLEQAASVLLGGGIAIIPTDTVYGVAAHPDCPAAIERIYAVKGRESGKPIALLVDSSAAAGIPPSIGELVPGALTVVWHGEGYRVPDHPWLRQLIARCGGRLRVTSANRSGEPPALDAAAAARALGESVDLTVDGGPSPGGVPSTVVKLADDGSFEVLRAGPVCCERTNGSPATVFYRQKKG